ncbi:MAG: hypothetical protein DIZ80_17295 [endosymbiont of Galathealinum brachiosum]|uniref:DUF4870 domain-containing protein n=1 Tax=endosymbiont of Galathealinum brachiosum TaxID=2200906 RepID=A0A370D6Z8_9GAMM|nr:MAG: hypothetical protein DIZ80_17295 [endosymbiont of Galathealinum brachiosum]
MQASEVSSNNGFTDTQVKHASNYALASFLNLTFLPGLAFIYLLINFSKSEKNTIDHYHALLGIKLNLIAGVSLFVVSALMILLGGFESPLTWVYVITYFTFVHTVFILVAVWAIVRAWSGQKLRDDD